MPIIKVQIKKTTPMRLELQYWHDIGVENNKNRRYCQYDPAIIKRSCVWSFYSIIHIFPEALHSD